jgi:hypothetical protein
MASARHILAFVVERTARLGGEEDAGVSDDSAGNGGALYRQMALRRESLLREQFKIA